MYALKGVYPPTRPYIVLGPSDTTVVGVGVVLATTLVFATLLIFAAVEDTLTLLPPS